MGLVINRERAGDRRPASMSSASLPKHCLALLNPYGPVTTSRLWMRSVLPACT